MATSLSDTVLRSFYWCRGVAFIYLLQLSPFLCCIDSDVHSLKTLEWENEANHGNANTNGGLWWSVQQNGRKQRWRACPKLKPSHVNSSLPDPAGDLRVWRQISTPPTVRYRNPSALRRQVLVELPFLRNTSLWFTLCCKNADKPVPSAAGVDLSPEPGGWIQIYRMNHFERCDNVRPEVHIRPSLEGRSGDKS